ncbi:hypothetical protein BAZSYMA_ACONTIG157899_0 [Bathymodiolus azoricus thioautotrophic gill symbiont]|uniref:Uncharacterized protein n=1 Tax=Bathymodiolus azoricus thioautotrophic gill symbiont TaxID=235205 RepID=A0A1H6MND3_9GAMM|nr:hypothetical protein BAZSYMA_ACONTIG157899_0 [Bathymodiolus azoricus thioautotrophic gill symbiont]
MKTPQHYNQYLLYSNALVFQCLQLYNPYLRRDQN